MFKYKVQHVRDVVSQRVEALFKAIEDLTTDVNDH